MPQVSKRAVKPELLNRMQEILWDSFVKLNRKENVSSYLDDILTPTERVMISKRLAMALLLSRGWDHDAISRYLKVSTSTISIFKNKLGQSKKGFQEVIAQIENSAEWEQTWLDLKQALEEILAERANLGRARRAAKSEIYKKYQEKRAKYKVL